MVNQKYLSNYFDLKALDLPTHCGTYGSLYSWRHHDERNGLFPFKGGLIILSTRMIVRLLP
jgi:hypothetical protein